jgi:hypothetical protein
VLPFQDSFKDLTLLLKHISGELAPFVFYNEALCNGSKAVRRESIILNSSIASKVLLLEGGVDLCNAAIHSLTLACDILWKHAPMQLPEDIKVKTEKRDNEQFRIVYDFILQLISDLSIHYSDNQSIPENQQTMKFLNAFLMDLLCHLGPSATKRSSEIYFYRRYRSGHRISLEKCIVNILEHVKINEQELYAELVDNFKCYIDAFGRGMILYIYILIFIYNSILPSRHESKKP